MKKLVLSILALAALAFLTNDTTLFLVFVGLALVAGVPSKGGDRHQGDDVRVPECGSSHSSCDRKGLPDRNGRSAAVSGSHPEIPEMTLRTGAWFLLYPSPEGSLSGFLEFSTIGFF